MSSECPDEVGCEKHPDERAWFKGMGRAQERSGELNEVATFKTTLMSARENTP
ncbi:MAG: hypothetical protein H6739_34555 [Alphaproteobacteria bacterium]|nr:hypothetical protein [Alphaproteobacteria bacterium]